MSTAVRHAYMLVGFALLTLVPACDEVFPPYDEPKDVLEGTLNVIAPDTVDLFYERVTEQYFLMSQLIVRVSVVNVYDNLLQGTARVDGTVALQSFSQLPRTLLIPLTQGNLLTPPVFQGSLALAPGDSAEFSELWLPFATDGKIVFEGLPFQIVDSAKVYPKMDFVATAKAQLFERVQAISVGDYKFSAVFRVKENAH